MAQNEKRVCLTMPTELQARVRKYMGDNNRRPMEWSLVICEMVDKKLKEKGY